MSPCWHVMFLVLLLLASPACQRTPETREPHPPSHIGLWEDSSGRVSIEQAADPAGAGPLFSHPGQPHVAGAFRARLCGCASPWTRPPAEGSWVLEVTAPWMDRVDLYLPRPAGGWGHQATGLGTQPPLRPRPGRLCLERPGRHPPPGLSPTCACNQCFSLNAGPCACGPWTEFRKQVVTDGYSLWRFVRGNGGHGHRQPDGAAGHPGPEPICSTSSIWPA